MKTYKVEIDFNAKTHLMGCLVVMANSKEDAITMCRNEIKDSTRACFKEPVEYTHGVVYCTKKSAYE